MLHPKPFGIRPRGSSALDPWPDSVEWKHLCHRRHEHERRAWEFPRDPDIESKSHVVASRVQLAWPRIFISVSRISPLGCVSVSGQQEAPFRCNFSPQCQSRWGLEADVAAARSAARKRRAERLGASRSVRMQPVWDMDKNGSTTTTFISRETKLCVRIRNLRGLSPGCALHWMKMCRGAVRWRHHSHSKHATLNSYGSIHESR